MPDPPPTVTDPRRRLDGWGFVDAGMAPPPALLERLRARLGDAEPFPSLTPERDAANDRALSDPARGVPARGVPARGGVALPDLGTAVSTDPLDRLAHARGRGLPDLLRLRSGTVPRLPDAVARPGSDAEVASVLAAAERHDLVLIPWGGGTSVTGGVNPPAGAAPVVTVDLARLSALERLDPVSGLATFGAGATGPQIEDALAEHGLTLGHFPQSWELSTLGGWIATRSAGQESLGYGRIETLVAGLELLAPGGRLELAAMPASAAGPDLRQVVLGSEGRLGVITRATVRLRRRPRALRVEAALVPSWEAGVAATRRLMQTGVPLTLLRLSDAAETEAALAVGLGHGAWGALARSWLRLRGVGSASCLLLLGAAETAGAVAFRSSDAVFEAVRVILRPVGAVWLGTGPGRRWVADRFRHPYLRDGLLDHGYATETLETAAPWSRLDRLYAAVGDALAVPAAEGERRTPVLCHLSHPYRDGASLYFTFFFRCPRDPEEAIDRWARLKRRATDAIRAAGGTVSHHHGVGRWHAPWLADEVGVDGVRALRRLAETFDPSGVLNPQVLLGPEDRLET